MFDDLVFAVKLALIIYTYRLRWNLGGVTILITHKYLFVL